MGAAYSTLFGSTPPTAHPTETIVSAPGKVLLAGGYLVLDRKYTGLVVATSSRFFCAVKDARNSTSPWSARITVRAGQFPEDASTWCYDVSAMMQDGIARVKLSQPNANKNKFVEITLLNVLQYAAERLDPFALVEKIGQGIDVVVLADNDFYSQRQQLSAANLPARLDSLAQLTPFCPLPRPIGETNKTGLGSSAALVTSLVAGLLVHFGLADLESEASRNEIHCLAQAAHCLAQGKVGSGFDVSSAVFGTHTYRRFSPVALEPLFDGSSASVLNVIRSDKWDTEQRAFRLPRGMRLLLADVDAGTDTPSFVGKVLQWRKNKPEEANALWDEVDESNRELEACFAALVAREGDADYDAVMASAATKPIDELESTSEVAALLKRTRAAITKIREGMRAMSTASGVPIEPEEQTRLLDACAACAGVIGGGVPGAGGYDAVWVLGLDSPDVTRAVEDVWSSWTEMSVCPLSSRQSDGGLQRETREANGLAAALDRVWSA